ncbi:calcium/sodium antiporter [Pseudoteredinibacter isoporae]|uniref:Cation:H+ antiporter n=1 Tax=Pseudoteredinibacter isoporae TaxID=570281 RepID=A0A7X0JVW6_9GAMM|nr:calcium/sodium antiporter [Pseudoteredinibacter isoporae]MBB6522460.1 cation:H+ antiporter [Pseudoteredinibacter isoporae]NHO87990.1 calcium/sodium antiporter [Pseudoteredinibacter isoporae]NIB23679.1 calcium/sodium antiporter [Pseudoteredinibacter isoporae]
MPDLLLAWIAVIGGLAVLVWSADRFVAGSAAAASNLGVSKLIIGLTIVSFGTSAPEILVAINAALNGIGDMAIGNAVGSNLANIGLVLGVTALVAPLPTQKHLITNEMLFLLGVTAVAGLVLWDLHIAVWEAALMLISIIPLIYIMSQRQQKEMSPAEKAEEEEEIPDLSNKAAALWFSVGLVLLIASSKVLVWGAEQIALDFGVSPLIIGLTLLAVGTSLPELAASIVSALKGHHDIAIGNIIGSNLFNILAVMSTPALISSIDISPELLSRDYLAMALITGLLALAIAWSLRSSTPENRVGRSIGAIFLSLYGAYYYWLFATGAF